MRRAVEWFIPVVGIVLVVMLSFGLGIVFGRDIRVATLSDFPSYADVERGAQGPTELPKQEHRKKPCLNVHSLNESALCAQWIATKSGQDSAAWAARTFWLNVGAVIGGLATLIAAAFAAVYAKQAAGEGRRSADAAEASILETMRIGEAQARAYLDLRTKFISCELEPTSSPTITFEVGYVNTGQTPAMNFRQWMGFAFVKAKDVELRPKVPEDVGIEGSRFDMGAGQDNFHERTIPVGSHVVADFVAGKTVFVLYGIASYDDVFGRRHELKFRRKRAYNDTSNRLIATAAGNESY